MLQAVRRGRKPQGPADLRMVADLSAKLRSVIDKKFAGSVARAAKNLGVCPASLYNYLNKKTVPDHQTLRRIGSSWGIVLANAEVNYDPGPDRGRGRDKAIQLELPLLDALTASDFRVTKVERMGPASVRVVLGISFGARGR
jgi:hypothetical protein